MSTGLLLELHARERLGMPDGWTVSRFRCLPEGSGPTQCYELVGAVAPVIETGKRRGSREWARQDPSTQRTIYITVDQHATWEAEWVRRTGNCRRCAGEGRVFVRWSVKGGVKTGPCGDCGGSGKVKQVGEVGAEGMEAIVP